MRLARLAVAIIIAIATAFPATQYLRMRMTNVDVAAGAISNRAQPGDLVVVVPWYVGVSFDRYYSGQVPFITVPRISFHRFHRYDLIAAEMQRQDQVGTLESVTEQIRATLADGKTLFLISDGPIWTLNEPEKLLPPVNIARDGWKAPVYHRQWSAIVGSALRNHADSISPQAGDRLHRVSGYENVQLTVIRGWHD
jgi:alkanesulfonate monooxygenase SsuD/methylene tetrahydromethanopterin reductase-like flavin-dependent oxidoreductase (luciferase family)